MDNTTLETILTVFAGGMADIREELNKLNKTLERLEGKLEDNPKSIKEINQDIKQFFNKKGEKC